MRRSTSRKLFRPSRLFPLALVALAFGFAFATNQSSAVAAPQNTVGSGDKNVYSLEGDAGVPDVPNAGQVLYEDGCATCHGINGAGTSVAPPLTGVGAAAVDFYLSTGRMPLNAPLAQAPRKHEKYNDDQRKEIVDYVASTFGAGGPKIPAVNKDEGDLVEGQQLFANNCAQCHNSQGSGGALGRGTYAPNLYDATPLEVAEAVRVGPGGMPIFGDGTFTDQQVNSLVKYVDDQLQARDAPGGLSLGSLGPLPEGFIAWIVGLGILLGFIRWIGTRI